jgi:hypothetical protein
MDVWRVQQAVAEGVRVEPARLRVPAVEYAELVLTQNPRGFAALRRRPALLYPLVVAYVVLIVVAVVRAPGTLGGIAGVALSTGLRMQQKRAARRAKETNAAAHDDVAADVDASSG